VRRPTRVRIDRGEPQTERQDRQCGACEHEQRARLAVHPPRLRRDCKRRRKAQQHEQEAPFGHEPEANDQSEEECTGRRRPLGIGERGDEKREHRGEQRERVGDALMDLPAEPEEQHEREGKGGGKARAAQLVVTGQPGSLQIRLMDPATRGEQAGLGACTGDSGAPVFRDHNGRPMLIGVVSWTSGPNLSEGCGGLTGVTPLVRYRAWIVDTARALGSSLAP
jgi:hypothetical protein